MLLLTAIVFQGSFLCGMQTESQQPPAYFQQPYFTEPYAMPYPHIRQTHHSNLMVQPFRYSPYDIQAMPEFIPSPDTKSCLFRDTLTPLFKKYEAGDKIIAGNKLYKIYLLASERGKKNIPYLPFWMEQSLYNRISISQALQGNYTTAIQFTKKAHPNDDTAITNRGLYLTKLAEKTTDPLLQTQYYTEAFDCFEKAASFDHIAQKHYCHSLANGIGCTAQEISNYFTKNIKSNKNERDRISAIKNFELCAKIGNMLAQCTLAAAYYSGTNGLPQSMEKSLLMCRYYLQSLARCTKIEELPIQRFIFDRIIKDLSVSDQQIIRDEVTMLEKYIDLFMANIKGDQQKIESLAGKNSYKGSFYKLLCKNCTLSDAYVKKIKAIKPDDLEIKNLTELEISILRDMAANPSTNNTQRITALNYVCGLVAYNDKNYKKAYQYLSQCTSYAEHDLLTNYLILESHYRMQKNDVPVIQKNLDMMTRINTIIKKADPNQKLRERDAYAQKKIIAFYQELDRSYGITLLDARQYNFAYQFIGHLLLHKPTTEQALCMLLKAERIINEQTSLVTELIDPHLRDTIDNKVDVLIHKNLSIETLLVLGEYLSEKAARPSLSSEQKSNYIKQALKHLPHHSQCKNLVSAEWSKLLRMKLATTVGILDKSIPYLDEAIALGSIDASLQKIHLLMALPSPTPAETEELINLMTQICKSNHPERFYLCNALAFCFYNSSNTEDRKKAFDYLQQATGAGFDQYAYLLGTLYFKGIPHYVEADAEKALYYFNKQTTFNKNLSNNHLIALKSHAYYKQEKYQEALDILIPNIPAENTSLKAEFLWLMGMIKIQLFNEKIISDEVINCCVEAYKILNQCPIGQFAPIESIQAISDEKLLKTAEQKTTHLLLTNNTTTQALEFCNIIGQLLWRNTEDQPVTDERRKTAIKYIRYAADNNNANAQEFAAYTPKEEIGQLDKIYYLESAYINRINEKPAQAQKIQEILKEWYPETLAQQATLITHYIKKNNIPVLQQYIQQLYTTYAPYITLEISQTTGNDFIQMCYGNEFLVQAANNFIQNPAQATPLQKYAAIFLGSLLAYSYDQTELLQAARYLEKAQLNSVKQNDRIKENKSILYYKLGCLASDPQNPHANSALATMYYNKSADLGNQAAQLEVWKRAGLKLTFIPKKVVKK
jgi:TPR repeat protein